MNIASAARRKAHWTLIAVIAAAGIAGPAHADPVGGGRVVTVRNADTIIIEDQDRVIYISSPRSRHAAKRSGSHKRVEYAGIGTEEALRQHNEVLGQLMDNPVRPVECR